MKRILFVDDEPNILQGLQRMLRPMRHEWDIAFAQSGPEALKLLEQAPFDIVVSDMRMPRMNGAQFLAEVRDRHPQIVRIILTGQSDQEAILRAIGSTHQYLSKPCNADTLKSTVARACALRDLLASDALKKLVSKMTTLPSPSSLYCQMIAALEAPNTSLHQVAEIVAKDVGMTAKILQLVNSSFFGLPHQISDAAQAISLIGLDTVKTLVLSVHVFEQYTGSMIQTSYVDSLWRHSLQVGTYARHIAQAEGQPRYELEAAFTAGLLHDVGKLALITYLPLQYKQTLARAQKDDLPLVEVEKKLLGATHAEVGAYLMGLWGLPDPVVEALAWHHYPGQRPGKGFSPLTAVHVANALAYETTTQAAMIPPPRVDEMYLAKHGLAEHLPEWREICRRTEQG
ncbi:MAG TPA: response regulator [Chthonomonadaceae bacterium]|nr:response regulator [Chthonomonadaceae bacterium]